MESVNKVLKCEINGLSFGVRIEELQRTDRKLEHLISDGVVSETDSKGLEWGDWLDDDSIIAMLKSRSEEENGDLRLINGGGDIPCSNAHGDKAAELSSSCTDKAAVTVGGPMDFQCEVGPGIIVREQEEGAVDLVLLIIVGLGLLWWVGQLILMGRSWSLGLILLERMIWTLITGPFRHGLSF